MRLRSTMLMAAAAVGLASAPASAALVTYPITATGAEEVNAAGTPNQGDPNGTATGFITLNNGTRSGTTGSATINLTVANIDGTFSGHHIHQAPSTTTGPIVLDFGNPTTTMLAGTPTAGTLSGTVSGLSATTITAIFANPTGFYYNLHSTPNFPAGAVRDQLPEPGCLGIVGLGAVGLMARRRSRRA